MTLLYLILTTPRVLLRLQTSTVFIHHKKTVIICTKDKKCLVCTVANYLISYLHVINEETTWTISLALVEIKLVLMAVLSRFY